jgi:hypothetical protein
MRLEGHTEDGPMRAVEEATLYIKGFVAGVWESEFEKLRPRPTQPGPF